MQSFRDLVSLSPPPPGVLHFSPWKGTVRFEDEFTADGCLNLVEAQGGAVWNGGDVGKMVFKKKATMINSGSAVSSCDRRGE